MSEVEQSILEHIRGVAAASEVRIDRDTGLLETGLLDSINLVGLIQFLEERFGIRIPDSDIGSDLFTSPASLSAYVEARLGGKAAVNA
ncbi:MAG TPA: acyl carrier protein [Devosia sp.]|nr:acyl carrier protein [Devosia sp.]